MSSKFTYDVSSPKQKLIKSLPFIGIVLLALIILAILIVPSRLESIAKCEDLGLGGGFGTLLSGGCSKNFNEIILVVGDTKNTPAPELNYTDYIDAALNVDKASVYAISVSNAHRNPKLVADYEEDKNAKSIKARVIEYLSQMKAQNDGADYLAAIQTAAESAEDKNKTLIYVIGSGLSDRGLLNFADDGLLTRDVVAEEIADQVAERLDDNTLLKGMTIVWDGLGQTVSPQSALDNESSKKLKDVYSGVLRGLGATNSNVRFKNKLNGDNSVETNSIVKTTETSSQPLFFFEFSQEDLFFIEGTSNFQDEQAARERLAEVAVAAAQSPSRIVVVTGYMASGNCDNANPNDPSLAVNRANAVQQLLVINGVQNQMEVVDGGVFDAEKSECDENGWNPELANYRRKVTIQSK